MKELKTYPTGRLPIWQQDLAWIQTAPKEVLLALINELGLGKTNFIITGCTITTGGGMVSMTGGWAYFNNEILPVAPIESTAYSGTPLVKLTKVTRCEGQKPFDNAGVVENRDAYQSDYLSATLLPNDTTISYDFAIRQGAWTLAERMRKNMNPDETEWVNAGRTVFYKKVGNVVFLKGHNMFNDGIGHSNFVCAEDLPIPAAGETTFPAVEPETTLIKIDNSGKLIITCGQDIVVSFNHISYLCDTAYTDSNDGHISNTTGVGAGGGEMQA